MAKFFLTSKIIFDRTVKNVFNQTHILKVKPKSVIIKDNSLSANVVRNIVLIAFVSSEKHQFLVAFLAFFDRKYLKSY